MIVRSVLSTLLLALASAAAAQEPPEPSAGAGLPVAAAESETVREEPAPDTPDAAGDEPGDQDDDMAVEPAETFDPTEEVDEDYSIPFPTDI